MNFQKIYSLLKKAFSILLTITKYVSIYILILFISFMLQKIDMQLVMLLSMLIIYIILKIKQIHEIIFSFWWLITLLWRLIVMLARLLCEIHVCVIKTIHKIRDFIFTFDWHNSFDIVVDFFWFFFQNTKYMVLSHIEFLAT